MPGGVGRRPGRPCRGGHGLRLGARRRLRDRGRRGQQRGAQVAGPALRGDDLPRPLPGGLDAARLRRRLRGPVPGQLHQRPRRVAGAAAHPDAVACAVPRERRPQRRRGAGRGQHPAGPRRPFGPSGPLRGRPSHRLLGASAGGRDVPGGAGAAGRRRRPHQQPTGRDGHERGHTRRLPARARRRVGVLGRAGRRAPQRHGGLPPPPRGGVRPAPHPPQRGEPRGRRRHGAPAGPGAAGGHGR